MATPLALNIDRLATPIGELVLVADTDNRLRAIDWTDHEARMMELLRRYCGKRGFILQARKDPGGLAKALKAYFAGDLSAIKPLAVETGGTVFQQHVWRELRRIPAGKTISYAELAGRIGRPSAVRAAGLANGANPVSIVIPCHRVIGSDGSLTGYGGGLHRKRWLLAHEGAI